MMAEVPTLCIDLVEFHDNTTVLVDEVLSLTHSLSLDCLLVDFNRSWLIV